MMALTQAAYGVSDANKHNNSQYDNVHYDSRLGGRSSSMKSLRRWKNTDNCDNDDQFTAVSAPVGGSGNSNPSPRNNRRGGGGGRRSPAEFNANYSSSRRGGGGSGSGSV